MTPRSVALPASVTMHDASALTDVDTAAVALLLQARRLAQASGSAVTLANAPDKLVALARLYGVESLLDVGAAGSA